MKPPKKSIRWKPSVGKSLISDVAHLLVVSQRRAPDWEPRWGVQYNPVIDGDVQFREGTLVGYAKTARAAQALGKKYVAKLMESR